ncbi:hypothetical protein RN607_05435 [Demequina capsici]|uniref:Uncharacterized protein n=1 Tax=Demequina capsici TaxID=3075620 RepID=A0AA96FF94_9MICO|nr:hypothetical protein [Demequina sp. PMTSA13]WNM28444.1 hypothetical protein RN607_05435 [Demequina sp. PMTSA13]
MDVELVTVTELVDDRRDGRVRWAISATFVSAETSEPRCIDYRVRVVPRATHKIGDLPLAIETVDNMRGAAMSVADARGLGEFPSAGIPGYVFEEASQARLLAKARDWVATEPERFSIEVANLIRRTPVDRGGKVRRGRPPSMSLHRKLLVLEDVERGYAEGTTRAEIARRNLISESGLRNLLTWARKSADPQLFTDDGAGKKAGRLTPAARQRLMEGTDG